MSSYTGIVQADDRPLTGSEVLVVDAAGKVLAASTVDASGHYRLAAPSDWKGGWIVARLYQPIIGARAVQVGPAPATADIKVRDVEAFKVSGSIVLPDGVRFDWVQLSLSPLQLDGVDPSLRPALFADGTGPGLRTPYLSERLSKPALTLRLLAGSYNLRVDRVVDAPSGSSEIRLGTAGVTLADGTQAQPMNNGFVLEVKHDLQISVKLRTVNPERH